MNTKAIVLLYRRTNLPYLLQRLNDGNWVELNREYKPLMVQRGVWIDYELFPFKRKIAEIPPKARKALDVIGDGSEYKLYLYHDGCIPTDSRKYMAAYKRRLDIIDALLTEGSAIDWLL